MSYSKLNFNKQIINLSLDDLPQDYHCWEFGAYGFGHPGVNINSFIVQLLAMNPRKSKLVSFILIRRKAILIMYYETKQINKRGSICSYHTISTINVF